MSKVIHSRVKEKTLYMLMDLLEANGIRVTGRPMASVVSMSLDALVNSADLPDYPDDFDFASALDSRLGVLDEVKGFDSAKLGQALKIAADDNEEQPIAESIGALRQEIENRVEALTQADAEMPSLEVIDSKDVYDLPEELGAVDLEGECMPMEKIRVIAPLDRFIEIVAGDEQMTLALELVYAKIPMSDWGSNGAEGLLKQVHAEIVKHKIKR